MSTSHHNPNASLLPTRQQRLGKAFWGFWNYSSIHKHRSNNEYFGSTIQVFRHQTPRIILVILLDPSWGDALPVDDFDIAPSGLFTDELRIIVFTFIGSSVGYHQGSAVTPSHVFETLVGDLGYLMIGGPILRTDGDSIVTVSHGDVFTVKELGCVFPVWRSRLFLQCIVFDLEWAERMARHRVDCDRSERDRHDSQDNAIREFPLSYRVI